MEYRTLGSTGVRVSTHCLGTMMFGPWGNDDAESCARVVRRAIDGGINFVDTADIYSDGRSEEIVGLALKGAIRDDVVLATKFHNPMGPGQNQWGNSRMRIMRAVEDSLRRLGTDHIDLYQVHRPEGETAVEETLSALTTFSARGRSAPSARRRSRDGSWSRRSGWPSAEVCRDSAPSSRRTRSSCATSSTTCSPWRSGSGWACWCGARSPAAG